MKTVTEVTVDTLDSAVEFNSPFRVTAMHGYHTVSRCIDIYEPDVYNGRDYTETCARLADAGLLVVGRTRSQKGYRYGSAWLKEELPAEIVEEIKELIER